MTTPATNGAAAPNAAKPAPAQGAAANGASTAPEAASQAAHASPPQEDARLRELESQTKRFALQQRKFAEEKATREKEWGEKQAKLKAMEEWEQYHAERRRNPAKYLEKEYGADWYDKLTSVKLNGVPTPDLVASEMDERFKSYESKLKTQEETLNKRLEDMQRQEAEKATQAFFAEVVSDVRRNISKYPHIELFQEDGSVWQSLTGEIDAHFRKNAQAIHAGEMEMLTPDEAASIVDKRIEGLAKKFEEARAKRAGGTGATPHEQQRSDLSQRSDPPRRSLSTNMSAASSGAELVPPKDDKERLERAKAAWERVKSQRQ